jgi:DNA replication protein DnaC
MNERRQLASGDIEIAMIPRGFWQASLSTASIAPEVLERIRRFGENHEKVWEKGRGLYLWGPNGVGKSSAAVAILKEYMRYGYSGLYVTAQELVDARMNNTELPDGSLRVWRRAEDVDILVLDDLGKEHRSESGYAVKLFDQLFRTRGAALRPTVVTSNMDWDKIAEVYKVSMAESMRPLVPLLCKGVNRRLKQDP